MYQAFAPQVGGSLFLISNDMPRQVLTPANQTATTSYRIRCLVAGYLTWSPVLAANATPTMTSAAPTLAPGGQAVNTMGYAAGHIEVLTLPQNAWFISSVASGFEIYVGEGL